MRGGSGGKPALFLFLLALPLTVSPLVAHELGTIRTTVSFAKNGTYAVEITIDREHLPPGFGAGARLPTRFGPIGGLPKSLDPAAIGALAAVANASQPLFDGMPVSPESVELASSGRPEAEWKLRLSGPIPGGARAFAWSSRARLGSYLLTLGTEGEEVPVRVWLEGGETSAPVALHAAVVPPSRAQVAAQYLKLGYTHILPKGTDHILFVLGIFLLSRKLKPILLQVTAFTIAHTITLALTIYGVVSLRPAVVEPLIALSIVYVAVENVFTNELNPWRVALVFGFGLIHGMGFAGVLSQLGLPRSEFLTALLSFNVGVELGQLTVILGAFLLIGLPFRGKPWYRARVVVPASIAIAGVGLFWAVQRIAGAVGSSS
ncbi:MAG: HupE/UreJ family protein [Acidobacteriota bacterium]|nr:HupE/UreJ family protein [Acidobacteriota bacterium]